MLNGPFAPWPSFSEEEVAAVSRVLRSGKVNYWTGEEGRQFEQEFAEFAGTRHGIALANGTVALDLALHGLGIGAHNGGDPRDEVIVTPRSFMASVSAVVNAGARPVFADVDRDSQNITPETAAAVTGAHTRAILCVHLAGWPCDMDGFKALVQGRDIKLIEDCAQAHGAKYKGQPVGGLGDVAAWSFCQDKIMTTGGEGGMVTCNDTGLWKRMWAYKDHGKSWEAVYERQHDKGFRWLHESFGTNFRMTEMQAAIGRIQLEKMEGWHVQRLKNADGLREMLQAFSSYIRVPKPNEQHAYYKFYAFVKPHDLPGGLSRDILVEAFNAMGLPCFQGSCSEIYNEKAFDNTGLRPQTPLKAAQELGQTSLMFLTHPGVQKVSVTPKMLRRFIDTRPA